MKRILLIEVAGEGAVPDGLEAALQAAGGHSERFVLGVNFEALLDKLEGDVLPVVLKPDRVD